LCAAQEGRLGSQGADHHDDAGRAHDRACVHGAARDHRARHHGDDTRLRARTPGPAGAARAAASGTDDVTAGDDVIPDDVTPDDDVCSVIAGVRAAPSSQLGRTASTTLPVPPTNLAASGLLRPPTQIPTCALQLLLVMRSPGWSWLMSTWGKAAPCAPEVVGMSSPPARHALVVRPEQSKQFGPKRSDVLQYGFPTCACA